MSSADSGSAEPYSFLDHTPPRSSHKSPVNGLRHTRSFSRFLFGAGSSSRKDDKEDSLRIKEFAGARLRDSGSGSASDSSGRSGSPVAIRYASEATTSSQNLIWVIYFRNHIQNQNPDRLSPSHIRGALSVGLFSHSTSVPITLTGASSPTKSTKSSKPQKPSYTARLFSLYVCLYDVMSN